MCKWVEIETVITNFAVLTVDWTLPVLTRCAIWKGTARGASTRLAGTHTTTMTYKLTNLTIILLLFCQESKGLL